MKKYCFEAQRQEWMEASRIPFAIYQFIDRRVVPLTLSAGFRALFEFDDRRLAYIEMENDMYRMTHPDDVARIANAAYSFATGGGVYDVVYRTRHRLSGSYIVIHAQGEHVYADDGTRLAVVWYTNEGAYSGEGVKSDGLTGTYAQMAGGREQLSQLYYDVLTGLPNMSHFCQLAEEGIRRIREKGQQPVVLFFDLCGMKGYNNGHGFAEGDRMIARVAKILAAHFSSDNCGRFGQDHYAVYTVAENIEGRLNALFADCRRQNTLSLRAGIYAVPSECVEIGKACDRAKMACDVNRKSYVSAFNHFNEALLAKVETEQYIIDNLDRAIREKWIQVYYQPIVRAANGRVCDEESLARWIDPERGMLPPGDFIPVLENAKLIYKLDLYIVEQTLEKLKRQTGEGLYVVPASINLSRADFEVCDIVEEVRRRVDASGLGRDKLTIEITESTVGSDFEFMKRQIERFQALGFQVWMDDFGSGYSSLDVLQSIHFDLIKLDMRFMQQFDEGEKSRIIITELVKMAIGLGIETVAEGVERLEQVSFLREIGCTKLQGYYYCKPISEADILERYKSGKQIGFENPDESEYYTSIGRVNLYDLAVFSSDEGDALHHYFDTLPMAILESDGVNAMITRCNPSYRDFMDRTFGIKNVGRHNGTEVFFDDMRTGHASNFMRAIKQCGKDGGKRFIEELMEDGSTVHTIVKRIAVNPVTGVSAMGVVVLGIMDAPTNGTSYTHIAQALSADYINLYYVNLDTDQYIIYSPDAANDDLVLEQYGEDFFNTSSQLALELIYPEDQARFMESFTREKVLLALNEQGVFTLTYRLMIEDSPTYVNMKAVRMNASGNYIIIGVNNVDAQMRKQEALERLTQERITYARINALSGDYICIYTVDPETEHFVEYSATRDYEGLGLPKEGDNFFERSRQESARAICKDDLNLLLTTFTKERVMRDVRDGGLFMLNYRLMIEGEPKYVCLRAAMMEEKDGPRLIVGINNVDAQVKRDQEYAHNLAVARNQANIDELTGVKNKHAYVDLEAHLNELIAQNRPLHFAVAMFDINGLKEVNDTQGHQAGDLFLQRGCSMICNIFKHSPVFRVGGDEFAVIARGKDYDHLDELVQTLEEKNRKHSASGGIVVACGTARFDGDKDVAAVFNRADQNMYADKKRWKGEA